MIGEYGETVILDWGLAKVKDEKDEVGQDSDPNAQTVLGVQQVEVAEEARLAVVGDEEVVTAPGHRQDVAPQLHLAGSVLDADVVPALGEEGVLEDADDHPDVEEFIWCKAIEERKARTLAEAGFDMGVDGKDGILMLPLLTKRTGKQYCNPT